MRRVSPQSRRWESDVAMILPVALIHGWGQHGGIWTSLLEHLDAPAVCNFELPGHGAAPAADFALDALADTYAAKSPASCVVIAWSLGAQIALRWAQRHPQQVTKLVLFSATPCFGERSDWPHGSPAAVQEAFYAQVAAAPERALQRFSDLLAEGEVDVRSVRRALRAQLVAQALPTAATLLAGLRFLADTDLRSSLRETPPRQPILLVHGEGDTITSFATGRWLADILPRARLHALPYCGHAPMISHAAETAAVITAFLDEPI